VISYKDIALQILSYSSQANYNCYRVIANFVPNFVGMATEVGQGKMQLTAFDGPSPKPPLPPIGLGAKISKKSYASRIRANFVPNFVAMTTGISQGKCNWQHSMAHPWKPPYRRKNLEKISYASRVKANFVPNFVAMTTGISQGKCNWQHSMAHPRKPPISAKISKKSPTQVEL